MIFGRTKGRIERLLIVEDEPLIAFDNEHFLTINGYKVVAAIDTAAEAQAHIEAGGIDLILCDIRLNDSDGLDVALAAKAAGIPLLFVTATCPTNARDISIGCLSKPYDQKTLKLAIEAIDTKLDGGEMKRLPKGLTLYL